MSKPWPDLPPKLVKFVAPCRVVLGGVLFGMGVTALCTPEKRPGWLTGLIVAANLGVFGLWMWRQRERFLPGIAQLLREFATALSMILVVWASAVLLTLLLWVSMPAIGESGARGRVLAFTGIFLGLMPIFGLLVAYVWRRWHCRWIFLVLAVAELPALAWLRWDEAPVEPGSPTPGRDQLSLFAAESDAVLRWYCSFDGQPSTRTFVTPRLPSRPRPGTTGEWRLFVAANSEIICDEWEAAGEIRGWIRQMDSYASIADVVGKRKTDRVRPFLAANRWESVTQLHCAYASLLAIGGQGDAALAVLRPMLSVCRKLQSEAGSQSRYQCASRAQEACQETLQFILRAGLARAEAWRQITATLEPIPNWREAVQRILIGEAGTTSSAHVFRFTRWDGDATWTDLQGSSYIYLPNATHRLVMSEFTKLGEVAAEGRGEGLRAHLGAVERALGQPSFRNAEGRLLAREAFRISVSFVQNAWKVEDQRRVLLAEVRAKLAEMEKREAAGKGAP